MASNLFTVLKIRDFRLLWLGLIVSNLGTWAQLYAEQWYIFSFHNSATDVSLLIFTQALPNILFMLIGGILADRFNRRKLLFFTQGAQAVLTLLLAVLITFNVMELYLYYTINFLYGLLIGLDLPARRSIVPNIVPAEQLSKALSVYNATFQLALFAGPVIGSALVALFGYKMVFYINFLSFSAILYAIWQMKIPDKIQDVSVKPTLFSELKHAGEAFRMQRVLLTMVILNFLFIALGRIDYLFPSISDNLLHLGVETAGWLNSSLGIGYVVGSVICGTFDQYFKRNVFGTIIFNVAALCLTTWVIAVSPFLWLDCLALFIRAAAASIGGIVIATALQMTAPDQHMGKVMGVQSAVVSAAQLISFPVGLLTDWLGIFTVLQVLVIGNLLIFGYVLLTRRQVNAMPMSNFPSSAK
ncbi:putative MFS family arabinose efflux permease [Tumebacillus sp. BK434]|uniref:MFS transporter n=1 Tax=Tumebacillus sp. BK434 TaxID=2512169 RepID=UPI00104C3664|nr:MFS transporter [Tumebacillus sp. BK434]TCP52351.1 putative MFS family arabinose efflux permease [Tumebacillus sp. BK434]